ncbi:hypothetical protein FQN57_000352 [Myotisia sp. PD_48]|nr:hypothetical protein FQN57_000352 [Myotisia sp. PD_48]
MSNTEPNPRPVGEADEHSNAKPSSSKPTIFTNHQEDEDSNAYLEADDGVDPADSPLLSHSKDREKASRLEDEMTMMHAEQMVTNSEVATEKESTNLKPTRSARSEPVDDFDTATNPVHEKTSIYKPPQTPSNKLALFFKKVHNSSFLIRYFTYITPIALIILIPLLLGALVYPNAHVGGVQLLWFCVWLEIFWLTLWAGRIVAKLTPAPIGIIASLFTNNEKKWRDLAKQLELPAALFYWWLGVEISFLPTMKNHHIDGNHATREWETIMNKIIISIFVGATLNYVEKFIIQLIAMSFHLRTYSDRIEINKFQIGSLTKIYSFSRETTEMDDREFEESDSMPNSGARTPMQYADRARVVAKEALSKVGDVAGAVAGDFTGKQVTNSTHPYQVVLTLLSSTSGSQVLARRLYRTFVKKGSETIFAGDLKPAFDINDEAEAAFTMFDKDMNGDISMEELEAVCVEIGRERKAITASLKDLDSVVSKLDNVFLVIVGIITLLVFISLISASTAAVIASAGSTLLALSWLFSATAQEFLQSIIFVFVKHPFDVGDRVSVYGNTGSNLKGDDYFVKEIALLYTEFKKMEGHVVQAPNSYLNTLFILNQRRSGGLAEAVPIIIKFGTTLEQIDTLRQRLLAFVTSEKREYQTNVLTELRAVTENYSITLNVVFFYKSNWQNELLRLQRRNKFICNLMICLQDIGIEGPRMNLLGYKQGLPHHIMYQGVPPQYSPNADDPMNPPNFQNTAEARDRLGELASTSGSQTHPSHSNLRKRAGTGSSMRPRGESTSRKHVDFSLGMSDITVDDMISDVYSTRDQRVDEVVRAANRETEERHRQESQERQRTSLEKSTSRQRNSVDSQSRSQSGAPLARGSSVTSSLHPNRYFGKLTSNRDRDRDGSQRSVLGGGANAESQGDENLMEQGRYQTPHSASQFTPAPDPRLGSVSTQGIHDDTRWNSALQPTHSDRTPTPQRRSEEHIELDNYQK